jgi:hypothetical protein
MTIQKGSSKENTPIRKQSREAERVDLEAIAEHGLAAAGFLNVSSPSDLPPHSTAQSLRQATVLHLQQRHGNSYVQRVLANGATNGLIQRQDDQEETLSTEGLGLEEELEGHPASGIMADIQRDGEGEEEAGTTANITLRPSDPSITRPPQAEIESDHSRANIAGWTTPTDGIVVSRRTADTINITINLSFAIELAREYTGERLSVLQDHENHHPTIAQNVAQEYLVDNLKTELEGLPDFRTEAPIQAAFQTAHNDFVSNEASDSRDFDSTDYSRMEEAYYGVRTPLADLASATAAVQTMVTAIDSFNSGATAEPEAAEEEEGSAEGANSARIIGLAQPVVDARAGLAQVDVDRLQYNREFKGKVSTASGHVTTLGGTQLNEAAREKLQELQTNLNSFTWTPA